MLFTMTFGRTYLFVERGGVSWWSIWIGWNLFYVVCYGIMNSTFSFTKCGFILLIFFLLWNALLMLKLKILYSLELIKKDSKFQQKFADYLFGFCEFNFQFSVSWFTLLYVNNSFKRIYYTIE